MSQTPFQKTHQGLIAENEYARLHLSPTHLNSPFRETGLTEETECNVLIRTHINQDIQCYINGQQTTHLGFITDGNTQWGRITTGDRVGDITFCIQHNKHILLQATLSIRPSKLDYERHYQTMRNELQSIARALVFDLPKHAHIHTQTTHQTGAPLDFVQQIEKRGMDLVHILHTILKRPHRQLKSHTQTRPLSLATGRDPNALAHAARTTTYWTQTPHATQQPFAIQNLTHLQETHRSPTTNTPLNRHLISNTHQLIRRLHACLQHTHIPSGHQLYKHLQHILHHRTFQNIPPIQQNDPPPIHIDDRYQTALTHIRHLNKALTPFKGGPFALSYRDTPTLYEYWTWFTLIKTFQNMGFKPQIDKNLFHLTQRHITLSPTQGDPSAIHLQKKTTHIRCLYNPTYTTASNRSLTHDLRPDIVIEIQTPNTRTVHAFDAKYRREAHHTYWIPLREDIDKMHAYRDAVGQVIENDFQRTLKSAIVLFPAPHNPAYHTHTFFKSLSHGIGGLPLLPNDTQTQTTLSNHITQYILP